MKIFIAGARAISKLNKNIESRLYNIYRNNYTVLVGDANGVDKAIQKFFYELNYSNVVVFASNGKARNNLGCWLVENVKVPTYIRGFDFYVAKDKAMSEKADYGFMIWNGLSKGTLNNIINLLKKNKKVLVFFTPKSQFICLNSFETLKSLLNLCSEDTKTLYDKLV